MLEDPSLSRQWVARRLQRALSLEYWGGPARRGLSRCRGALGPLLASHAAHSAARKAALEILIQKVGSTPYSGWGIGARVTPALTGAIARVGPTERLARMLAEHTLSEYRTLDAFVDDAPGVSAEVGRRIAPMLEQVGEELVALRNAGTAGD